MDRSFCPVITILLFILLCNRCLRCCKAGDRYSKRGAGYIVQAKLIAELYGCRITAMLAADTDVELRIYGFAKPDRHLHEIADAVLVKLCKRIVLKDLSVIVSVEELACVVT
mgnify:CR=1 FL=1